MTMNISWGDEDNNEYFHNFYMASGFLGRDVQPVFIIWYHCAYRGDLTRMARLLEVRGLCWSVVDSLLIRPFLLNAIL